MNRNSIILGLLAIISGLFWNELNIYSLKSSTNSLSIGTTVLTADDASYIAPVENYLKGNGFRNNLKGDFSYYMRPPGYSFIYLSFRSWLPGKQALYGLKLFQVLLFGVSIALLYLLLLEIQIPRKISVILVSFFSCSGIAIGFLYYTLTEAITPALVILLFYFLIRAKNVRLTKTKRNFYIYSFVVFGFLFITRPALGVLAFPIPVILLQDKFVDLKKRIQFLVLFVILGFGPMITWQARAYHISGEIVGLHPIYSTENLQTPFRPVHQAFWELAKSWGEKGADFHKYTDEFWAKNYTNSLDSSSVSIILKKLPVPVVEELGENRLKKAFESYRLAILEQRDFLSEMPKKPKENFKNELIAIKQFNDLTAEYRTNHFMHYHVFAPFLVFKEMAFHSNLSLYLFQHTWRGNILLEIWRYICAIFHCLLFLLLPLSFFIKTTPKEIKLVSISVLIYIFYLMCFQRGIEERYTLPILALMLINLVIVMNWIHSKYFTN